MVAAFFVAAVGALRFLHYRRPIDMSVFRTAFASVLLLTLAAPCVAQPTPDRPPATVVGRVTDASGTALPGANVVLRDRATGQRRAGTSTDSTGAFALRDVAPGRYRLAVSFVGYARHVESLALSPGDTVRDTIALRVRSLPQDAVVVTTRRAEPQVAPVTVSNLTAPEVDRRLGVQDLPSLLGDTPSTTFHSQNGNGIGYSTLRIRGFDQRRIAVSINGVPQNDPEDFNVFWVNLYGMESSIEDVQVQRGAGSSLYGSVGIGGAINVVTDPFDPEPYARARVGAGSFGTRRVSVTGNSGLLGDRYVVNARVSRVTSDGYRRHAWTEFNRFFGGLARYGDRSTLTIQAFGGIQQDGLAFGGIPKSANDDEDARRQNPSAVSEDQERFNPPQVHLNHEWQVSPDWSLDQTAFWIKGEGYFDYGAAFRSADFLRLPAEFAIDGQQLTEQEREKPLLTFGLGPDDVIFRGVLDQHQVGWIPTVIYEDGTTKTTLGVEARLHRSLRWGRIQDAGPTIPDAVVGPEAGHRLWNYRGGKIIGSAFASHLFQPVDRLAVQADLQLTWRRYRFYDEETFDREGIRAHEFTVPYFFANPRVGVTLYPDRPVSAYASVALANREPRRTQLYDGNEGPAGGTPQFERRDDGSFDYDEPLIEPEHLVDVELGGSVEHSRYRLSANFFWMEFWDEIVPSGAVDQFGVPRTGNADRTRHAGLELEGSVQLVPGWTFSGNAMLARTRFVDFTEYRTIGGTARALERDGNPIAASPEVLGNLRSSYAWRGLTASLHLQAVGRQYVDNSGGEAAVAENGALTFEDRDARTVDPYALLNTTVTYEAPASTALSGLRLSLNVNNLLDAHVLRHGFQGAGGPRFYPAATRTAFVELRYTL